MYPKLISIVGVLALASVIQAQNNLPCHSSIFQFTARHSLNISEYMGDWYMQEIASSDIGNFPTPEYKCAKSSLSQQQPLSLSRVDSFTDIATGITYLDPKSISVNNTRSPYSSIWNMESTQNVSSRVIILFADLEFKQWTVQYSCSHRGPNNYRYEVVMAMTRSRTIDPELRLFLKALMVGQGFRIGDHHPIDQENCFN